MTPFKQSLPVLITSFVNKTGSIGLSLLPMLLVDGMYSSAESSLVMSAVKGSTLAATLLSGWLADSMGLRRTVLVSLLMAGVGLTFLPVRSGIELLLVSGVVTQLGITSINTSLRFLLTRTVERRHQKESLGWMRAVNNLGQILSYALATVTATLGAKVLIWFDAFTSFTAWMVGRKLLPTSSLAEYRETPSQARLSAVPRTEGGWRTFLGCTVLLMGWNFMYELYMVGVAGRLKLENPTEGLRMFSLIMVLNTVLCAAFAVVASRWLTRVVPSLLAATTLTAGALALVFTDFDSVWVLALSALSLTLGEIVYGALAQFLLIRAVPVSRRENTIYSGAILFANLGKMLAAGLAFPLIVYPQSLRPAMMAVAVVAAISWCVVLINARSLARLADG